MFTTFSKSVNKSMPQMTTSECLGADLYKVYEENTKK